MSEIFNTEALQALDDKSELKEMPRAASPALWLILSSLLMIGALALFWCIFGKLNYTISATGVVFPFAEARPVSVPFGGTVHHVIATNGQQVTAGTPVVSVRSQLATTTLTAPENGVVLTSKPAESKFDASENIIAGNTILYGATSGEVFINGRAGERFAVRNSGATAVVEGAGDHCCEYMTGGRVVVLGTTGRNFAAGMSGGLAYVWDKNHNFDYYCNMDMIELDLIEDKAGRDELRGLIEKHYKYTGSALAKKMLDNWSQYVGEFIQVTPIEYRRILEEERMKALQQKIDNVQRDY